MSPISTNLAVERSPPATFYTRSRCSSTAVSDHQQTKNRSTNQPIAGKHEP
ncbi:hypothetical protein VB735_30870 [Halotia wernerae UHCC 0503]|nr:hypothetical protein [Halotia wernerae UHCC 0503]